MRCRTCALLMSLSCGFDGKLSCEAMQHTHVEFHMPVVPPATTCHKPCSGWHSNKHGAAPCMRQCCSIPASPCCSSPPDMSLTLAASSQRIKQRLNRSCSTHSPQHNTLLSLQMLQAVVTPAYSTGCASFLTFPADSCLKAEAWSPVASTACAN